MKSYNFTAVATTIAKGYAHANTREEAMEKILAGEYDDINDTDGLDIMCINSIDTQDEADVIEEEDEE